MSEETSLKGSAIPEIYYDIIARVVPGALILGTYYGWQDFDLSKLGIGLIFFYMLGLVLDVVERPFWRFWFWLWSKLCKKAKKCETNDQLLEGIRHLPPIDRTLYTKMMAEKTLFSSLSIGALVMCLAPPNECVVHIRQWHFHIERWLFAFLYVVFTACMLSIRKSVSSNISKHKRSVGPAASAGEPRTFPPC
jgi:hypothetical protein